jgi:6-phosphogluconolactonase
MNPLSRRSFLKSMGVAGGSALAAPFASGSPQTYSLEGPNEGGPEYLLFVGTYTGKGSRGIYAWRFNSDTGRMTELGLAAETENPSFLVIHPKAWFLYAVNETPTFDGKPGGSVSSFAIDASTGRLSLINTAPTKGADPCHVVLDHTGQTAWVANYSGGSVAVFNVEEGRLGDTAYFEQFHGTGPNKGRQEAAHAHSTTISRDNRWAVVSDLGSDRLYVYQIFPSPRGVKAAKPAFVSAPAGAGPRHATFSRDGRFLYSVNEMASSVSTYSFDTAAGSLKLLHTVPALPAGFKGENTAAEVRVDADGRFLYSSNRGHDSISIFSLKTPDRPHLIGHAPAGGKAPRNFNLDPTGKWLLVANQDSDNIVVYPRDPSTGMLKASTQEVFTSKPVCLRFLRN